MNLGDAIKQARINSGLNQVKLSNLCGLTPSSINQFEKGNRTPNLKSLTSILSVLKLTFEQLCEVKETGFCPLCKRGVK